MDNVNIVPNNLAGFQFEPRLNAAELEQLQERENDQQNPPPAPEHRVDDRQQVLQNRLEGFILLDDWCECGGCRVPQNPRRKMCVCCNEQTILDEKIDDGQCITNHPDFESVCLTPAVLHIVVNSMEEVRGYAINHEWTNKLYRLVAYRSYTYWIYRRLGRHNRRVIPACAVVKIRDTFPEANDADYIGYRDADEEEIEAAFNL